VPKAPASGPTVAATLFTAGVAAYERKQLVEADAKFAAAINADPTWADSYYNRALIRAEQGDQERARLDFEEYLRLKPQAPDRAQVVARIETLRVRPPSPGQALGLGLIIPGAGQFYTRRPIRGALFLAATAAAVGFGLQTQTKTTSVEQTGTDPFGNPYTYTATRRTTDRPNLIPGIAVAGALALGSAIEAYSFARRSNADAKRVSMSITPSTYGLSARVSLLLR
jgi:tetratricopeptide (TPR) repeat protein